MLDIVKITYACLAFAVVLPGCGTMSPTHENVRQAIEANNDKWEEALSRGDASAIAALYTANAQLLPATGNVVSGQQAIREYWQGAIAAGFKAVTLTALEVESFGDTAHEVGKYTVPAEGGAAAATGDYIVVWKRDNGVWKLHRDIWTTNASASQ